MNTYTNTTLCCHWCGVSLANASSITYLNGNLPVCDLCLLKSKTFSEKKKEYTRGYKEGWEDCVYEYSDYD